MPSCKPSNLELVLDYNITNLLNLPSNNNEKDISPKISNNGEEKIQPANMDNDKKDIRLADINK